MTAPYDWLQSYEALQSGAYGNVNDPGSGAYRQLQNLTQGNTDYSNLYGTALTAPTSRLSPNTDAGPVSINDSTGVDWSQLPTMGPAGYQLPANSMWRSVGGRSGITDTPGAPTYNDPNYGMLQLAQKRAPDDTDLQVLRAGAIALASLGIGGGIAAGAGELGAGAAAGDAAYPAVLAGPSTGSLVSAGLKTALPLAQVHWSEVLGGAKNAPATSSSAAAAPTGGLPTEYNPGLFGNLGSMAAVAPSAGAPVMSSLVPSAYSNSTPGPNQVTS